MTNYFSYFPAIKYKLSSKQGESTTIRNIFFRFKILDALRNNILIYYDYYVKEDETPEIIAYKYYKDVEKHWLVMLANDVVDGQFDWPLSYNNFQKYLAAKYGSPEQAQLQLHHYELTINRTNSVSGITISDTMYIDENTYNNNNLIDVSHHLGIDFNLGQTVLGAEYVEAVANEAPTQVLALSDGSYVTIKPTAKIVTCYDYEDQLNEKRRNIKLISREYLEQIQTEFQTLTGA